MGNLHLISRTMQFRINILVIFAHYYYYYYYYYYTVYHHVVLFHLVYMLTGEILSQEHTER